ncbi:hypothetical protein H0H93_010242 [Arthromyces matolae]|nr:hypothetical protein H0H93_010242 [Arthromyces matolae]
MDSVDHHLSSLKVADLKAVFTKANVRPPPRKNEMIEKIKAEPAIYQIYLSSYHMPASKDEALDDPPQPVQEPSPPKQVMDDAEKRRLRAERFGIPLVEQKPSVRVLFLGLANLLLRLPFSKDSSKLAARAARFNSSETQKQSPHTDNVDDEEQEKRRKRAERFGIPL